MITPTQTKLSFVHKTDAKLQHFLGNSLPLKLLIDPQKYVTRLVGSNYCEK